MRTVTKDEPAADVDTSENKFIGRNTGEVASGRGLTADFEPLVNILEC